MGLLSRLFGDSPRSTAVIAGKRVDKITVEEIHAAVDESEDGFLKMINNIIETNNTNTSKITILEKETRKAAMLKDLGFNNSELMQDVQKRKDLIHQYQLDNQKNMETLSLFEEYKKSYPHQKIVPFELFYKVLEKYNLVYAPNSAYIKDVPEKNLLEISKAGKIKNNHQYGSMPYVSDVNLNVNYTHEKEKIEKLIDNHFLKNPLDRIVTDTTIKYSTEYFISISIFGRDATSLDAMYDVNMKISGRQYYKILDKIHEKGISSMRAIIKEEDSKEFIDFLNINGVCVRHDNYEGKKLQISTYIKNLSTEIKCKDTHESRIINLLADIAKKNNITVYKGLSNIKYKDISKSGIFIAAPKSHFNLSKLTDNGERGFFEGVAELKININIEDPIAFEFLEGCDKYPEGFVRILSKWGTEDDQSYLDPTIQNENLN